MAVILLVEDERTVLNFVSAVLRTSGWEVLTAGNGLEGLAVFRSYANLIDVVLTDLKMPVMDGYELIGRIRDSKPDTRIICMSGFSERECPPGVLFLAKPFTADVIRGAIEQTLDEKKGQADPAPGGNLS